jgi:hypothetical protein
MSGRSLVNASLVLLLALGTAAPGAAQVIEDPHWRRIARDDAHPQLHPSARPEARGRVLPIAERAARNDR